MATDHPQPHVQSAQGEIVKEQLRITDEMINLKPPSFPQVPKGVGLGVGFDE
jgi:hypothetical protein